MAEIGRYPLVDTLKSTDQPLAYRSSTGETVRIPSSLFQRSIPEGDIFHGGFFDYNDSGVAQSYTGGSGWQKLTNDTEGAFSLYTYRPSGIGSVWNASNSQFDFSSLKLGDMLDIRVDLEVTTTAVTQPFQGRMDLAIGGDNYQVPIFNELFLSADTYSIADQVNIYMGNEDTLNLPAEVQFASTGNATVTVLGWYVKIIRRG